MAHQSLYRRYRPRRFDEVRGQEHVVGALRNAVRDQSEGHAYLFSGPRGTGKTSTARILAKALNCENLQGGEPCCECTPCVDMEAGRSFDLFELDAASNNGVDAVRDLIERTAVGSPGRTKVYILDEVHMLSSGASNALLKTLEEPPEHVRFVLATTDPQKVLPTIKSRTQHFEFQLLSADELERQVRFVVADAELDVDDEAIAWVVQKGRGSSRDTLSALDQVVAAGGVVARGEPVEVLYEALVGRDTGAAVLAVADALAQGHDPRVLGAAFLDSLRDAFLLSLDVDVPHLMDAERERYGTWATQLGTAALTRAMEAVGSALVEMRQAADPRVPLEVALVRLTTAGDDSFDALVARIERLEGALADGVALTPGSSRPAEADGPDAGVASAPRRSDRRSGDGGESPAAPAAPAPPAVDADDTAPAPGAGDGPARARAELARRRERATPAEQSGSADAQHAEPAGPSRAPEAAPAPPTPPTPPTPPSAPAERSVVAPEPTHSQPPPEPSSTGPTASAPPTPPSGRDPAGQEGSTPARAPGRDTAANGSTPAHDSGERAGDPTNEPGGGAETSSPAPSPVGSPIDGALEVDAVAGVFEQAIVPAMKGVAKAIYSQGRVLDTEGETVVFALAIGAPMDRAERSRPEVEAALAAHFGRPVSLRLVDDGDAADVAHHERSAPQISGGAVDLTESNAEEELSIDITELEDADDVAETGIDRLTRAFPGAQLITEDEVDP